MPLQRQFDPLEPGVAGPGSVFYSESKYLVEKTWSESSGSRIRRGKGRNGSVLKSPSLYDGSSDYDKEWKCSMFKLISSGERWKNHAGSSECGKRWKCSMFNWISSGETWENHAGTSESDKRYKCEMLKLMWYCWVFNSSKSWDMKMIRRYFRRRQRYSIVVLGGYTATRYWNRTPALPIPAKAQIVHYWVHFERDTGGNTTAVLRSPGTLQYCTIEMTVSVRDMPIPRR